MLVFLLDMVHQDCMDKGDIELLSKYFPLEVKHNFNGDIMKYNL